MRYAILAVFLLFFISACDDSDEDANMEITLPVSVSEVKTGSIEEYIESTGNLEAIKRVLKVSEVEGKYFLQKNPATGKLYAPGDRVKEGTLIIRLVNKEHENQVKIESQKLNLDISRREYEKQKSLYEKGGITLRDLINSERAFVDAKYTYDNALLQLAKLRIVVPFDGVIVSLPYYTPGGNLTVNKNLVEIMDYHRVYSEISFPAKVLFRIKSGLKVRAMDYTVQNDTLPGMIKNVNPSIDPATRSFKASVVLENPRLTFRPGMFVRIETVAASKDSVIVIPRDIILSKRSGKTVYVVQKGAAQERTVTTGLENDSFVEILAGIKIGERLVTRGYETLRNRSKVKIVQ